MMTQDLVAAQPVLPILAVVIIARNEEQFISSCLASVLQATARFASCDRLLVDSCSTDRTVEIARSFPVRVVELHPTTRLSPALGRLVGERLTRSIYILFVDGDTELEAEWIDEALSILNANPRVAGVSGKLREIYYRDGQVIGENPDCFHTSPHPEAVYQLGGNAIYRRVALEAVGSFNPYIVSYEEAELAERLRQAGFITLRIPKLIGTHRTGLPGSLAELQRRYRENLITGYGQVLRVSLRNGLFWRHAWHMKRYLQFDAIMLLGLLCGATSLVRADVWFIGTWAVCCLILIGVFMLRSRSIKKPFALILDWSFWVLPLIVGFLRTPIDPRNFSFDHIVALIDKEGWKQRTARSVQEDSHC